MHSLRTTVALGAALLLLAQGLTSLILPPSPSMEYSGTSGDIVNDSLFAVGLLVLGCFLLLSAKSAGRLVATGLVSAGSGALLLSAATVATVAAAEERWDAAYVAGFLLSTIGYLIAIVGSRSWTYGALLLGTVLALAFFAHAGALALGGAALLVVLWDQIPSREKPKPTPGNRADDPATGLARPGA